MADQNLPLLPDAKGQWDDHAISRRRFFEIGFWTVSSVAGISLGSTGARFFVADSLLPRPGQWVTVGLISDLPTGSIHKARFSVQTNDVWREVETTGILYALTEDGVTYTVFDATCTHLGCNVRWHEEQGNFVCPCHQGVFSRTGEVVSGPPPKPLRQLETRVEQGMLLALV
jgi:Rieske Fe-S protein